MHLKLTLALKERRGFFFGVSFSSLLSPQHTLCFCEGQNLYFPNEFVYFSNFYVDLVLHDSPLKFQPRYFHRLYICRFLHIWINDCFLSRFHMYLFLLLSHERMSIRLLLFIPCFDFILYLREITQWGAYWDHNFPGIFASSASILTFMVIHIRA